MPELPEVEAVCQRLRREVTGSRIISARLLRKRDRKLEKSVAGRSIKAVERIGKNILLHLEGDLAVRVRLRMTGDLYVVADLRLRPPTTRAYFELDRGRALVLDDTRALGIVELVPESAMKKLRAEAGIEPLSDAFTLEKFMDLAIRSRAPAKLFLMNQSRVAGLGNIYTAEVLYRARVHPAKPMNKLRRKRLEAVHSAIVAVLTDAVKSAVAAYKNPGRFEASETFHCAVYDREGQPCFTCNRPIKRIAQGGRSTYYCPGCQR